jgi:molybdopterin-synthase adenylyltransferase
MPKPQMSVALAESTNARLHDHLVRSDGQEDLTFALWSPSWGKDRLTALVHTPVFPEPLDRQVHGNVSFNPAYFERVCALALREECGIAFLHSHPYPGWQAMSADDVRAENQMASAVDALVDLPLLGMTTGSDGTWSARLWEQVEKRHYQARWCHSVRVAGKALRVSFNEAFVPKPAFREQFKRTVAVWGKESHAHLARLRIGIVGLGSVGSIVAESLARMGVERFSLIDFDFVEEHNLDRLLGATLDDVGMLKVDLAERQIRKSATAQRVEVKTAAFSLAEQEGYRTALDCDVLFSCVDRPRARHILNHFAYAHLIPVIDGGVDPRFDRTGEFSGVDWQLQTVAPGRPCLACLDRYAATDVALEEDGLLDDPSYLKGLPCNHRLKRNENVFPFCANLASLEVIQLVALATGAGGIHDFGVQRYRYRPGLLETDTQRTCRPGCDCHSLEGKGDRYFSLLDRDLRAEAERAEAALRHTHGINALPQQRLRNGAQRGRTKTRC